MRNTDNWSNTLPIPAKQKIFLSFSLNLYLRHKLDYFLCSFNVIVFFKWTYIIHALSIVYTPITTMTQHVWSLRCLNIWRFLWQSKKKWKKKDPLQNKQYVRPYFVAKTTNIKFVPTTSLIKIHSVFKLVTIGYNISYKFVDAVVTVANQHQLSVYLSGQRSYE